VKRILVALDSSPRAPAVLAAAVRLAELAGAKLVLFRAIGVPCQMFDALPLAAEPYAAVVDAVFSCVSANFARVPAMALLRSPHLQFITDSRMLRLAEVAALDRGLSEAGYLGGLDNRYGKDRWVFGFLDHQNNRITVGVPYKMGPLPNSDVTSVSDFACHYPPCYNNKWLTE
jgi:nucleotide-binding universal stress UspA family protein